jgi:hypothetical protein
MKGSRTRKLATSVTAALAAALAAVPLAQARLVVDAQHAALLNRQPVVRTDARHAALLNDAPVRVQVVQPQGSNGPAKPNLSTGRTSTATVSTGLDWSDAGIGAGSAIGLFLLAGGGVLITRRKLASA